MTTPTLPTPPAGTRWREYRDVVWTGDHFVFYGVGYKTAAEMIVAFPKQFTDDDHAPLIALKATPTEPLPAPVVDRSGEAWELIREFEAKAWSRGRRAEARAIPSGNEATDALLLALAPHWRELAALAGDKSVHEQFADVLAIQLREATGPHANPYMIGLYNGMLMIACNLDGTEFYPLQLKPEPKVTVLEGWYNIPSARLSDHIMSKAPMFYQSKEDAQRASDKYPEGDFAHTAVRLAVVEDAS